jgi:carboxypeptidase family protein/TonB-dependent receptor-like protein
MEAVMTLYGLRRVAAVTAFSLVLAGLGVSSARAQGIYQGKITGALAGPDGGLLPGATVEISSPGMMGGKRSATTSAKGTYVFLNLPVGTYTVVASMPGFKTVVRENIAVSADTSVTLDIVLPVGEVAEAVTVTAEGPVVDTKTSTIDSKIDQTMLEKLPTTRDAFLDLALTTPGMAPGSGAPTATTEFQSPTAYSSATNENVFLINGVDATNPRAGSFGSLVNVNYDAVEEVRVVALGSKAEYGSFSGAAIDVLTKSGSNSYHGSAAGYTKIGSVASNQPAPGEDLGADFLHVSPGDILAGDTKQDWETSFTIGGPIMKDKLWFFSAFDYTRGVSLPPLSSVNNESWGRFADLKLSAAPFANHRAFVAYHYENNNWTGGSWGTLPGWDPSMTYGSATKNNTVSAQWQWFSGSKTTLTGKYLGFWTNDTPTLPDNAPSHPGYINWWKWTDAYGSFGINGAFPYVEAYESSRHTVQADFSHYAENFLGEHDLKFGVQYTKGRSDAQGGYFQGYVNFLYPYRWTQNVQEMKDWYGDTGLMFYNNVYRVNPTLTARTADSTGAFFDDQWSPTKRMTINLGLRFDHMTAQYGVGKVYDFPTSPAGFSNLTVLRDRASSPDVFNFKTWSPRVGLTYKLTEDNKTVVRASAGRYYTPLTAEFLRRFGPDMPPTTVTVQMFEVGPWSSVDTNGDGVIDSWENLAASRRVSGLTPLSEDTRTRDQSWTLNTDPNLKDQHTDQLTLNLEREIARDFSVSATYIYKHGTDLYVNIPINRTTGQQWQYERVPFTTARGQNVSLYSIVQRDYNGDGVVDDNDVQWIHDNNTYQVQNFTNFDGTKVRRDYHGGQLVFKKRYSDRWQALASVVYSSSDGFARRPARQDQSFNVEGPMFYDDNWMSNVNYTINNLEGTLPFTPKWEIKVAGSYTVPKIEVDLGLRLRSMTGRPVWQLDGYPEHTQFGNPPGGVIVPGGTPQIVAVDPNKPDYLPTLTVLDLHAEKAIKFAGGKQSVNLVLDGFNVFNTNTATDMTIMTDGYGRVTSIPQGRRFRLGLRYQF